MASADSLTRLVCLNCKLRKKRCDKAQPCCGYCTRRKLKCQYKSSDIDQDQRLQVQPELSLAAAPSPLIRSSLLLFNSLSEVLRSRPKTTDSTLYLQILRIIRTAGQFVDDISARYFRGIHTFIPIISRGRMHDHLLNNFGAPPPADFSILLLSLFLVTHHPESVSSAPEPLDQETLYFATKALFAQVQASHPPSLNLIQAAITIATYEYANGRIHDAFTSIGTCARMGYAAGLHLAHPVQGMGAEAYQKAEEEANTWWGIITFERILYCELINDCPQPFLTEAPSSDFRLPTELDSHSTNTDTPAKPPSAIANCYGAASLKTCSVSYIRQATWFLDQVFKTLGITDADLRYTELDGLDHALRTFLSVVMSQFEGIYPMFCTTCGMIMRALFIIHFHILDHIAETNKPMRRSPDEWLNHSHAALDTATKMMVDIAASQSSLSLVSMDAVPPLSKFVTRAAIRHVRDSRDGSDEMGDGEKQLKMSLQRLQRRWGGSLLE